MVAMSEPFTASTFQNRDIRGLVAEIEEMIQDVGKPAFVAACHLSSAADYFERAGSNKTLRIAQVIIREIAFSRDAQLEAKVMALGAGIILGDGDNMTRIAAAHGLTKQALSKRVLAYCDANNLPPSPFMRSAKDRKTYAQTNQPRMSAT